ncbi:transmembrane protein 205-like isoform X1 [Mercenaria mercenaria]|uniref:transmembrane protein 205-like isoform X1 n=2 Tax=Mercenaria mercenaria TaxID=6596 RepID=UPI00234E78D3|nr:transmembrane protein 205-like isoform X1 [Mercenaria mercenaria]
MGLKVATATQVNRQQSMCVPRTSCSKLGRYFSLLTIVVLMVSVTVGSSNTTGNRSTNILFLHLLSFAVHFGVQCWVTFVAGFAMFFSVPRIMFGHLQSRMFPLYFTLTLVLSCVTLLTYVVQHPYPTMTSSEAKQLMGMCICVISIFINSFYLAPEIVNAMISIFEIEKSSGVAYVIGYCDRTELKKDPKYCEHYKRFRLVHSISGVANVVTLICNIMYLYHLASISVSLHLNHLNNAYCI